MLTIKLSKSLRIVVNLVGTLLSGHCCRKSADVKTVNFGEEGIVANQKFMIRSNAAIQNILGNIFYSETFDIKFSYIFFQLCWLVL